MQFKKPLSLLLCLVLVAMLFPWGPVFAAAEDEQFYIISGWVDAGGNSGAVQSVTVNGDTLAESGASISVEPGATVTVSIVLNEGFLLSDLSDGVKLSLGSTSTGEEALSVSSTESSISAPSADWLLEHPDNPALTLKFATAADSSESDDKQTVEKLTLKMPDLNCGSSIAFDEESKEYSFLPELEVSPTELKDYMSIGWVQAESEAFMDVSAIRDSFTVKGGEKYLVALVISTNPAPDAPVAPASFIPTPESYSAPEQPCPCVFDAEMLTIAVDGCELIKHQVVNEGTNSVFYCVLEVEAKHIPGEPVNENVVPAICTENGSHDVVVRCTSCDEVISSETVTDEMLGHDWNEWVTSKEPTIDEPGERARTCKRNPKHKETEEIPKLESCTVTFETNGGSAINPVRVEKGKSIDEPTEPTKANSFFDCWCSDPELTNEYDFSTPVNSDITLYAKWSSTVKIKYTVIAGGGSIWGKGGVREVEIIVKRSVDDKTCFSHFTGVQIDGVDLERDVDYTASAGSTVIDLKPVALNRFNTGNHTVTILFDDGKAVAGLIIKAGTGGGGGRGNGADTGDTDTAIWTGLLAASALCATGIVVFVVKKRKKNDA